MKNPEHIGNENTPVPEPRETRSALEELREIDGDDLEAVAGGSDGTAIGHN